MPGTTFQREFGVSSGSTGLTPTQVSAKVETLGLASVVNETYGAKCDAVVIAGAASTNLSTTLSVPGGHGLTTAYINKRLYVKLAGAARDLLAAAVYVSATTATLAVPASRAIAAVDCGIMQSVWNTSTGVYDTIHAKHTATATVAAGSTALTDTGGGIISGGSLAYWLTGATSETLATTIVGVPDSTSIVMADAASTTVSGVTALAGTLDTTAVQAAITALKGTGTELVIPASCILGPVAITDKLSIKTAPGVTVYGIFQGDATLEKLFESTGDDFRASLVTDGSYSPVKATENKYVFHLTGNNPVIIGCSVKNYLTCDTNPAGGITGINSGAVSNKVTHAIYCVGNTGALIERNRIDNISGAGTFLSGATDWRILFNNYGTTFWYTVHLDKDCIDWTVGWNTFASTHPLACHWGAPIDCMSNLGGGKNKRGLIIGNDIATTVDYGTPIRILSSEDIEVTANRIHDLTVGAFTGGPIQWIGIDTRAVTGLGDNGPSHRINVHHNLLEASGKGHTGVYSKNGQDPSNPRLVSTPSNDIWIEHNHIRTKDASNYFETGVALNGQTDGGLLRPKVRHNRISVITRDTALLSGAPAFLTGAIALIGTTSTGVVDQAVIEGNTVEDLGTPNAGIAAASSRQIGFNAFQNVDNLKMGDNRWTNFRLAIQTNASSGPTITGLNKRRQTCISCSTDMLLTGGPWDTRSVSSATTYLSSDVDKFVDFSSGTFNQAPPVVGVLGDGGIVHGANRGAGTITFTMGGGNQTLAAGQRYSFLESAGVVEVIIGNASI